MLISVLVRKRWAQLTFHDFVKSIQSCIIEAVLWMSDQTLFSHPPITHSAVRPALNVLVMLFHYSLLHIWTEAISPAFCQLFWVSFYPVWGVTIHNVTKSIIMTSHIPSSFYFVSTKSPAQILHSTLQPGSDGRRQCQSNMCSSGLTNAIYQVDQRPGGPDQRRRDANRAQCAGAHQHSRIS